MHDFEDRFHLHGDAVGQRDKTEGAASVPPVRLGAEDFVQQVGHAVDDFWLIGEARIGVDAAEHLDDAQVVEGAVGVPDGAGSGVPLLPRWSGDVLLAFLSGAAPGTWVSDLYGAQLRMGRATACRRAS